MSPLLSKDSIILSLHNELVLLRQLQQLQVLPGGVSDPAHHIGMGVSVAASPQSGKQANAPNTRLVLAKVMG